MGQGIPIGSWRHRGWRGGDGRPGFGLGALSLQALFKGIELGVRAGDVNLVGVSLEHAVEFTGLEQDSQSRQVKPRPPRIEAQDAGQFGPAELVAARAVGERQLATVIRPEDQRDGRLFELLLPQDVAAKLPTLWQYSPVASL